ncbi:uncharacterized protein LOC107047735 [Diachasma alloeum]|uniref:uncharacterized protein LOC107047735 n=1 Tax=Diachasma alloeum TaxID=454923 RepID=UPI00073842F3|nr:uncharacterized protein LOC107047735 [Diachasma alloeum]
MRSMVYFVIQSLMLISVYHVQNVGGCKAKVIGVEARMGGAVTSLDGGTPSVTYYFPVSSPGFLLNYIDTKANRFQQSRGKICDKDSGDGSAVAVTAEILATAMGIEDCTKFKENVNYSGSGEFEIDCGELHTTQIIVNVDGPWSAAKVRFSVDITEDE